jgi:type 2 lantibiotic biosynthesis protein LanM
MRDGAVRGIELELLARGLLHLSPALWPLLREEERALEQMDIPIFTMRGDATRLSLGERHTAVARSGLEVARSRFASLGPADLERQLHIIRTSFALRYPESRSRAAGESEGSESASVCSGVTRGVAAPNDGASPTKYLSREELIAAALQIADEIRQMALTDCRGDVTWITVEPISTSGHGRLQATGYGLYDGLGGIAVFLAAAARCGRDQEIASLARRALRPLRERLHSSSPAYVDEYGIGGACGIASALYALLRAGTLLGDRAIVDDALLAACQITPAVIARDTSLDVLYGSAGAVLALLTLHRTRPVAELLDLARRCGRHLLAQRQATPGADGRMYRVWHTAGGHAASGFAHGAAGIAWALLRLDAATCNTEFREAALAALSYEDALVDRACEGRHQHKAGAPEKPSRYRGMATGWCRGAAGIGLARIGPPGSCYASASRPVVERSIALVSAGAAVQHTVPDNLCCGAFGAIELLLADGLRWGDSALLGAAHARASAIVTRRRTSGRYRLAAPPAADVYDPGLYRGTAGIGYGLLRLCHPEVLPSLLLWE